MPSRKEYALERIHSSGTPTDASVSPSAGWIAIACSRHARIIAVWGKPVKLDKGGHVAPPWDAANSRFPP
jgi:hypothetical protein